MLTSLGPKSNFKLWILLKSLDFQIIKTDSLTKNVLTQNV